MSESSTQNRIDSESVAMGIASEARKLEPFLQRSLKYSSCLQNKAAVIGTAKAVP
jgi:hypothetical protein